MPHTRRKKHKTSNRCSTWTQETKSELLAWAEYCRRKDGSGKLFERTIVRHLQNAVDAKLSWSQIDEQVATLVANSRLPLRSLEHEYLYKDYGRKIMPYYAVEDRDAWKVLLLRVNELMKDENSSPSSTTPSQAASRSACSPIKKPFTVDLDALDQVGQSRSCQKRSRSERGKRRQRSKFRKESEIPQSPAAMDEGTPLQFDSPAAHAYDSAKAAHMPTKKSCASADDCEASFFVHDVQAHHNPARDVPISTGNASAKCIREEFAHPHLTQKHLACTMSGAEDTIIDAGEENTYLWRQVRMLEQENMVLRDKLFGEENAALILNKEGSESIEEKLKRSERALEVWKHKAQEKARLVSFIKDVDKHQKTSDVKILEEGMDNMHFALDDILEEFSERQVRLQSLRATTQPALQTLCRRVLGNQGNDDMTVVSCSHLVRSLVAAAVCEWVLESQLRENCISTSPLMDEMLAQVTQLGGDDAAKALQFSAVNALLSSPHFQLEVIRRRAELLASTMEEVLIKDLSSWYPDATEIEDFSRQWREERQQLELVFAEALRIKASTLVSNAIFEVVFPQSGACVNVGTVRLEGVVKSVSRKPAASATCIVQLPLAPGLRSHICDRPRVDYNSFRKPGVNLAGPYLLITQPVVLYGR